LKFTDKIHKYIEFSSKVKNALEKGEPVIALESSVIAQGLPSPVNFETAIKLEKIATEAGAVPATVAIINGKIKIGISRKDIMNLAESSSVFKVSKRDIAPVLAAKGNGGTTVAATGFIASIVGIKIFATGGTGGVHEDKPFDISADLMEIASNGTVVVSSGPKSIIDLTRTMEYLETLGVTVIGYKTEYCPHFFLKSGEYPVNIKADTPEEIARIIKINEETGIRGGILVVNPLEEEYCIDRVEYKKAFEKANNEAKEKGIAGNKLTPFLLERINLLTEGKSQKANLILLEINVRLASKISIAYKKNSLEF